MKFSGELPSTSRGPIPGLHRIPTPASVLVEIIINRILELKDTPWHLKEMRHGVSAAETEMI